MPDIGAMIAFVRASTGREPDLIVSKPNRMIGDAVAQKLGLKIEEVAMVGDRLYTDIALGQTSCRSDKSEITLIPWGNGKD